LVGAGLRIHGQGVHVRIAKVRFRDMKGAAMTWLWDGAKARRQQGILIYLAWKGDHRRM